MRENDRKRMLGHSFSDVTNAVYGHRQLDDLKKEIEKIQCYQCVTNDSDLLWFIPVYYALSKTQKNRINKGYPLLVRFSASTV